jgi:hypothetical protein
LKDDCDVIMRGSWNVRKIIVRLLLADHEMFVRLLWDYYKMIMKWWWDDCEITIGWSWNVREMVVRLLSADHELFVRLLWDYYSLIMKCL